MKSFRNSLIIIGTLFQLLFMLVYWAVGAIIPGPKVSENKNKHNLSAVYYDSSNNPTRLPVARDSSIKYKAVDSNDYGNGPPKGRQVCIFCHTPHNANTHAENTPLWNRSFSDPLLAKFNRYSSGTLKIRLDSGISATAGYGGGWKPDGSSKLCLSCHDGVSKLGQLWRGGTLTMISPGNPGGSVNTVITGIASFKPDDSDPSKDKMKRGHHPVSFKYNAVQQSLSTVSRGFRLPTDAELQLRNGKMQCTTCHDPHQNQSDDDACYNIAGTAITGCTAGDSSNRKVAPFWRLHKTGTAADDQRALCENCHSFPTRNIWDPAWPAMP